MTISLKTRPSFARNLQEVATQSALKKNLWKISFPEVEETSRQRHFAKLYCTENSEQDQQTEENKEEGISFKGIKTITDKVGFSPCLAGDFGFVVRDE